MKKPHLTPDQFSHEDLKKSLEKKNRELEELKGELEIEAALERVRIRTMAMHKSEELSEVAVLLYQELTGLGLTQFFNCGYVEVDEIANMQYVWTSTFEGAQAERHSIPLTGDVVFDSRYKAWKRQDQIFRQKVGGSKLKKHFEFTNLSKKIQDTVIISFPDPAVFYCANFQKGYLHLIADSYIGDAEETLLVRFAKVFEQTYTRFLDLQKAEAQAREAQIEAALEKVRSRSMAMHSSEELADTASILFEQLHALGEIPDRVGICIINEEQKFFEQWVTNQEGKYLGHRVNASIKESTSMAKLYKAWKDKKDHLVLDLQGQELKKWMQFVREDLKIAVDDTKIKGRRIHNAVFFSNGMFLCTTHEPVSNEIIQLLIRFVKVFEQTYTRFLDLKNAEAQAREAQIEASLERVRAKAMAMHKSEELNDVATVLFQQIRHLGGKLWTCGIVLCQKDSEVDHFMVALENGMAPTIEIPNTKDPATKNMYHNWKNGADYYVEEAGGKDLKKHYDYLETLPTMKPVIENLKASGTSLPTWQKWHAAYFTNGYLMIITLEPYPQEEVFTRFAKVFEQAYTRFLDLKKAEAQAREAQIEAALERVRSKSMAMHKSEELGEVVAALYDQMNALDFAALGCELILCDEKKELLEYWTASPEQAQLPKNYPIPRTIHPFFQQAWNAWKKRSPRLVITLQGANKRAFDKLIFEKTKFKKLPKSVKGAIRANKIDVFSLVPMKYGLLEAVDTTPLTEEKFLVLERFAKVFEQTYTRFLDLQKAEAQAREAQIEASMERIRAMAMSMQKGDELVKVVKQIDKEIVELGIEVDVSEILTDLTDDPKDGLNTWVVVEGMDYLEKFHVPFLDHPITTKFYNAINSGTDLIIEKHSKSEKNSYFNLLFKQSDFRTKTPKERQDIVLSAPVWVRSAVILKNSSLNFSRFRLEDFIEEEKAIFRQIGKVFEQAYTRFLDLKKAEEQAREAQIEASLERIRSASMAMQKSEELPEVALTFLNQIEHLAIPVLGVAITEIDLENDVNVSYFADNTKEGQKRELFTSKEFKIRDFWMAVETVDRIKAGEKDFTITGEGEQLELWISWIRDIFSPERAKRLQAANFKKVYFHVSEFHDYSTILFSSLEPLTKEFRLVIQRLVATFRLSYLRFLDLQKAEAQAREAEIELSLERIRAQAMAMQESSDLLDIVVTMRKEFVALGHDAHYFWHMRWLPEIYEKAMTSGDGTRIGMVMSLPRHIHGDIRLLADWEKSNDSTVIFAMDVETALGYVHKMITLGDFKQIDPNAPTEDDIRHIGGLTFVMARTTHGEIGYSLPGIVLDPPQEDLNILTRFAGVFDLAYRRFEDLKSSELQHRESQIELALERVRARTMAMQHSSELADASYLLVQQVKALGIDTWGCAFNIFDENQNSSTEWFSNDEGSLPTYKTPREGIFLRYYEAGQKGETLHVETLEGKACQDHYEYLCSLPVVGETLLHLKESGVAFPSSQIDHVAYFKYGYLLFITFEPVPEAHEIFKRFAKVFEQTYTRFLDLLKAEAQAREAQIQLALERVRAKTMAMHKSEELAETAAVLFQQLHELDTNPERMNIGIVKEEEGVIEFWSTEQGGKRIDQVFKADINEPTTISKIYTGWKNGEKSMTLEQSGQDLKNWLKFLKVEIGMPFDDELLHDKRFQSVAYFSHGMILTSSPEPLLEETMSLLPRFAKVFEQTYTRFMDLQKAEGQAREAQIEAALERVRSRSMAMHKSDEIEEVAKVLLAKIQELNIPNDGEVFIVLFKEDSKDFTFWLASPEHNFSISKFNVPYADFTVFNTYLDAKAKGLKFLAKSFSFKEKSEFFEYAFEHSDFKYLPEDRKKYISEQQTYSWSAAWVEKSGIQIPSHTGKLLSEKEGEILKRFATVFEQSYIRFLDLQKSEAQAREAEIQLALERVRARTMAMHSSQELSEVVSTLYQQIESLGFAKAGCELVLCNETTGLLEYWHTNPVQSTLPECYLVSPQVHNFFKKVWQAWKQQAPQLILEMRDQEKRKLDITLFEKTDFKRVDRKIKRYILQEKVAVFSHITMKYGLLEAIDSLPLSEDQLRILQRFAKVFEQTYTRFLDLQKAEAQAREAQIEAALERVRARSMAMHLSQDLQLVVNTVIEQLQELKITLDTTNIIIFNREDRKFNFWTGSNSTGKLLVSSWKVAYIDYTWFKDFARAFESGQEVFTSSYSGDQKKTIFEYLFTSSAFKDLPDERKKFIIDSPVFTPMAAIVKNIAIQVVSYSRQTFFPEEIEIVTRFAKVFEQTYTRFLDLQKAEAQAREAQIEAALERVRAKALAMQTSADLHGVSMVLREQMGILGQPELESSIVHLYNHSTSLESWYTFKSTETNSTKIVTDRAIIPVDSCDYIKETIEKYNSKESEYTIVSKGKKLADWYNVMVKVAPDTIEYDDKGKILIPEILYYHHSKFSGGALLMISNQPPAEESKELQRRAARVFNFAYQRFLDLKKAEAQAREAQIETALERVRSKTMAMHTSQDVAETVSLLFNELVQLGLEGNARCGIGIMNNSKYMELWTASTQDDGTVSMNLGKLDLTLHPLLKGARNAFKQKKQGFSYVLEGKDLYDYYTLINQEREYSYQIDLTKLPERVYHNDFTFADGILYAFTNAPITDEISAIFRKFAVVFGQTYRRYLDLVNAEAQAREAQIEAALERVRSRSMAMQRSNELNEILLTMFGELSALGLALARCVIWIFNAEDRTVHWWAANPEVESGTESFLIPFTDHPTCNEYWKAWEERRVRYFYELSGETKRTWDDYLFNFTEMARLPEPVKAAMMAPEKVYLYNTFRDFGVLFPASLEPISEENFDIIERFGKVFDQSYTRFKDIQQAEAREKEAIKQSSLDRVRAEIASMRTTKDLERITPLIWRELRTLDVPFFRCGVFIMNDEDETAKVYLSTPSGESLAVWNSAYANVPLIQASAQHWREQKVFRDEWDQKQFIAFTKSLIEQKLINDPKHYQAGDTAPKHLVLQLVPFDQGMLYVGSDQHLDDDQIELVQALARSFSVAYARYEDFNELENAKTKVEATLNELKSTQAQLIQSEKMASLGELTAGIAHEIQNPLNFVNNFSEVSGELVDEMNEELEDGNMEEVKAITQDLKQNLEKINHHGQRASSIVKGMLEHSRTGTRQKELTDINILTDEYLRLSYHGLRAKDKFFNAEFKIDLDPSLPKINVIGQDIGRVLLNLINNAFYAVSEKAKKGIEGFAPVVTVKTKKVDHLIEIRVKDNADGIPPDIVNKIFQPFFTTKPTGSGTGLGLSLSYDIVTMGHNGSLEVDTTEGLGSEFIVQLPAV